jgi:hypothetical protein
MEVSVLGIQNRRQSPHTLHLMQTQERKVKKNAED